MTGKLTIDITRVLCDSRRFGLGANLYRVPVLHHRVHGYSIRVEGARVRVR